MSPQTVQNYLSYLGAIFAVARPAWGYPLDQQAIKDAYVVAKKLGVTSKGGSTGPATDHLRARSADGSLRYDQTEPTR